MFIVLFFLNKEIFVGEDIGKDLFLKDEVNKEVNFGLLVFMNFLVIKELEFFLFVSEKKVLFISNSESEIVSYFEVLRVLGVVFNKVKDLLV